VFPSGLAAPAIAAGMAAVGTAVPVLGAGGLAAAAAMAGTTMGSVAVAASFGGTAIQPTWHPKDVFMSSQNAQILSSQFTCHFVSNLRKKSVMLINGRFRSEALIEVILEDVEKNRIRHLNKYVPCITAAGAGLTGFKMARRTGGIEEFQFEPIGENHQQGVRLFCLVGCFFHA